VTASVVDSGRCKAAAIISASSMGTEQANVLLARGAEAMYVTTGNTQDYFCFLNFCRLAGLTAAVMGCAQPICKSEPSLQDLSSEQAYVLLPRDAEATIVADS